MCCCSSCGPGGVWTGLWCIGTNIYPCSLSVCVCAVCVCARVIPTQSQVQPPFHSGLFRCFTCWARIRVSYLSIELMPASPPACVVSEHGSLSFKQTPHCTGAPLPTLKWESLHLARSNVIIVWFWWDPNAEAGSVMLSPSELHPLSHCFSPVNMTLDTNLTT